MESSSIANRIQMTHKAAELVLQQAPELKPHIAARRRQETTAAGVPGTVRTYWLDVYPVSNALCSMPDTNVLRTTPFCL